MGGQPSQFLKGAALWMQGVNAACFSLFFFFSVLSKKCWAETRQIYASTVCARRRLLAALLNYFTVLLVSFHSGDAAPRQNYTEEHRREKINLLQLFKNKTERAPMLLAPAPCVRRRRTVHLCLCIAECRMRIVSALFRVCWNVVHRGNRAGLQEGEDRWYVYPFMLDGHIF